MPAILAYKTNTPIIVPITRREKNGYIIHYSTPFWPDLKKPRATEVKRLMQLILKYLEDQIQQRPQEWLWLHNRWKQQTPHKIIKKYRMESLLIILPLEKKLWDEIIPHLPTLLTIYAKSFVTLLVPQNQNLRLQALAAEIIPYTDYRQTLLQDYRFKLVFNFSSYAMINKYYKKLSAFRVLTTKHFDRKNLAASFLKIICRPGTY